MAYESQRPGYGQQDWQPKLTYTLLGIIVGTYVLQNVVLSVLGPAWHNYLFVVAPDFLHRPWSVVTSTFAHSLRGLTHILFNGFVLYFFGQILERIWGWKKMLAWFLVSGAVAGIVQVLITGGGALGASGALMMVFGVLVVLMPKEQILVFGIVPLPFWVAAVGYAVWDGLGVFFLDTNIGHLAHLTGLGTGLVLGYRTKTEFAEKGLRLVRT